MLSFGVALQKQLDVPVGLMVNGIGGTSGGASKAAFEADPVYREALTRARQRVDEAKLKADYEQALKA